MESFGDIERRVKAERAKAADIDAQRAINAELLYKRQQRLRRAIIFVCNNLIKKDVPYFNVVVEPAKHERAPITNIFGKFKGYEDKVVEKPKIVRGWAIDEPYKYSESDYSGRPYYRCNVITEDGEYYDGQTIYAEDGNKPQIGDTIFASKGGLSVAKVDLRLIGWGLESKERYYNEAEKKLVNFAIDQQINLSELDK